MTRAPRPGKLVVVGGHSRGVGKTSVLRAIACATPGMDWHVLKISNHSHQAGNDGRKPNLLRLADEDLPGEAARLTGMLTGGRNLLVESNRIAPHLPADLVVFVVDPLNPDWKASSASCLSRADALVFSQDGPSPAPLLALRSRLPAFRLTSWNQAPLGLIEWLSERLPAGPAGAGPRISLQSPAEVPCPAPNPFSVNSTTKHRSLASFSNASPRTIWTGVRIPSR